MASSNVGICRLDLCQMFTLRNISTLARQSIQITCYQIIAQGLTLQTLISNYHLKLRKFWLGVERIKGFFFFFYLEQRVKFRG